MDSRKITDPLNRGMVGGLLGMPADMLTMLRNGGRSFGNLANRLAGVNAPTAPMVENPVYGQEWWGNKMQQAGYVSPNRNKLAEFGAGLLDPGSVMTDVPMLAKGLFALGDPAMLSAAGGMLGMTSKSGKASDVFDAASALAKKVNKSIDLSYQIDHKPMTVDGGAALLHDLEASFGPDIYTKNALQFFGSGDPREKQILKILSSVKGNPNAMIDIYRGVPEGVTGINAGDWVTLSPEIARDYGNVIKMKVPASHITSWPDSLLEFGYYPK